MKVLVLTLLVVAAEGKTTSSVRVDSYGAPLIPASNSYTAPISPISPISPASAASTISPASDTYGSPVAPATNTYVPSLVPPTNTYSAPVAPPTNTYSAPVAPPTNTYNSPVAPPTNTYSAPVEPALDAYGAPNAPLSNSYGQNYNFRYKPPVYGIAPESTSLLDPRSIITWGLGTLMLLLLLSTVSSVATNIFNNWTRAARSINDVTHIAGYVFDAIEKFQQLNQQ